MPPRFSGWPRAPYADAAPLERLAAVRPELWRRRFRMLATHRMGIASRLGKNLFPTRLQSAVECGADSCCVVADFDWETRPAGLQATGDDYGGIEQQNRPA